MTLHVIDNGRVAFTFLPMPRRSKLTMDDVARAAGVSKQTVSAVINNKSGISEKTRARIRKIIARLDYHPNLLAGSLRGQRAMQALLKRLERPGEPAEVVTFETTLIIRRSSGGARDPFPAVTPEPGGIA